MSKKKKSNQNLVHRLSDVLHILISAVAVWLEALFLDLWPWPCL